MACELTLWNSKSGGLADVAEKYIKKGDRVYIDGRIEYRTWEDRDGKTRYSTEINAREMIMLGSRGGGAEMDAPARASAGRSNPSTLNFICGPRF